MSTHFLELTVKNFLSTGNIEQTIKLDASILTLIVGLIGDEDSGMKNGAGKTTILQAISYALFGKPLTRIKIPNLVNNINKKSMSTSLTFRSGSKRCRIERGQKPNFLRLFLDDEEVRESGDNKALGENRSTQVEINRLVGMSHLMFKHIVGLNTFTEPFLKESDAVQREIIEELLGITQISQRAEKLKLIMIATKDEIKQQEAHIKATTDANNRIEITLRQLEQTERAWVRTHESTIAQLSANIDALGQIDYEAALAQFDVQEAYDVRARDLADRLARRNGMDQYLLVQQVNNERELKRLPTKLAPSPDRADSEVQRKRTEILRHEASFAKFEQELERLRDDRASDDETCSTCGQPLAGTDHLEVMHRKLDRSIAQTQAAIERERSLIVDRTGEIALILKEAEDARTEFARSSAEHAERRAALEQERESLDKMLQERQKALKELEDELVLLGDRPEVPFASRDQLYETRSVRAVLERDLENESAKTDPYADQVVAIRDTLQKIDYSALNDSTTALKHQDFLMKLLTSKDSFIRKKIVDQNLPYLNSRIAKYLRALTLPHTVVFQSDLGVEISHLGNDYDFEQLSRGEMNRVIMATAFAFRDVWENLNSSINLLWVDELLDQGTCTPGVEAALGILQEMGMKRGKNVFLVSHKDELRSRINDVLICNKQKEFTCFETA